MGACFHAEHGIPFRGIPTERSLAAEDSQRAPDFGAYLFPSGSTWRIGRLKASSKVGIFQALNPGPQALVLMGFLC